MVLGDKLEKYEGLMKVSQMCNEEMGREWVL